MCFFFVTKARYGHKSKSELSIVVNTVNHYWTHAGIETYADDWLHLKLPLWWLIRLAFFSKTRMKVRGGKQSREETFHPRPVCWFILEDLKNFNAEFLVVVFLGSWILKLRHLTLSLPRSHWYFSFLPATRCLCR